MRPVAAKAALRAAALALGLGAGLAAPALTADPTATMRGTRTLYLVRHGLYDESDPRDPDVGKALLPEGREQAALAGRRLAGLPDTLASLHASTMTRARETAEIIGVALHMVPRLARDLRECTPPTSREDIVADHRASEMDSCRARLEGAFARFARPTLGRDSVEVLVCHGNVIRWFVCRALGADPRLWANMGIGHCSLTKIVVRPDGAMRLLAFSDVGHLPSELQTSSGRRGPAGTRR